MSSFDLIMNGHIVQGMLLVANQLTFNYFAVIMCLLIVGIQYYKNSNLVLSGLITTMFVALSFGTTYIPLESKNVLLGLEVLILTGLLVQTFLRRGN